MYLTYYILVIINFYFIIKVKNKLIIVIILIFFQKCIEYTLNVDYVELDHLISKIMTKMTLSPMQRAHLSKLIGTEHYVEIENKIESISS